MVPSGLAAPLRWTVDLNNWALLQIDGPLQVGDFEREQAELAKREFDGATRGSEHDDKELPRGTVVYVGTRRGVYRAIEKRTFGANEHTIHFYDGSLETLKLKEISDWRFVQS
eukprot:COSAG04_NODE_179_length_21356_cov_11.112998_4_plen_113_part_00